MKQTIKTTLGKIEKISILGKKKERKANKRQQSVHFFIQYILQSGVESKGGCFSCYPFLCKIEQPDLDLNVATIHKHPLLWAIISKTKLIWSINLSHENEQ